MIKNSYNILIVEDEWINAEFISDLMIDFEQIVVGIAKSAQEAIEIFKSKPCDFVFMDINIKGSTDGIQLAKELNKIRKVPIVFITAFGDSQTIKDANETNIYGFLVKPFSAMQVEAVLNVAITSIQKEKKTQILPLSSHIELGFEYSYDKQEKKLYLDKKSVSLSKNETKLLCLLCSNLGHTFCVDEIHTNVWEDKSVTNATIRETIMRLKKKIFPLVISNHVGLGYSLEKENK